MSSISSINSSTMSGMQRMQRPDPSKMAENLFSKLDTSGKGYLEKSDLQSAFAQLSSTSSSSSSSSTTSSSASVDDVFKSLDSDSDGKITKDEMTSGLQKIAEQLDSQFNKMREGGMSAGGGMQRAGGMPPPPPPDGADSAGFTQEELTSQLEEIGSSDSKRSSLISSIVDNFEEADSDSDGKVSFKEAMAYDQANSSSSSTSTGSTSSSSSSSSSTSSTSDSGKLETQIMKQIMELMHAYGGSGSDSGVSSLLSTLSTSA